MKITGPNGTGSTTGPKGARPSAAAGFRLPGMGETDGAAPTGGVARSASVMGVDALLALQDVGGPLERRRRATNRAGRILDVLDDVKLALLDGGLSAEHLERLRRAVREQRDGVDDPGLSSLLDEIETRAAVEMAKLEAR